MRGDWCRTPLITRYDYSLIQIGVLLMSETEYPIPIEQNPFTIIHIHIHITYMEQRREIFDSVMIEESQPSGNIMDGRLSLEQS